MTFRSECFFQGESIPTLEGVLDAFGDSLRFNIELKSDAVGNTGLESTVAQLVMEKRLVSNVVVSSFSPLSLWRMRRASPPIARGLLYAPNLPIYLRRAWTAPLLALNAVHPEARMVDANYMRWAKSKRYRVNVWTVNMAQEMERLLDLGVDILITDRPDLARRTVDARLRQLG